MHKTTQVLLRNRAAFARRTILVLGLADADSLAAWAADSEVTLWCSSFADYQRLQRSGLAVQFGHAVPAVQGVDAIVLVLPKSRQLLACWLAQLDARYAAATPVYLVGEKSAGIQGASKQLGEYCTGLSKLDAARHCQLWRGELRGGGEFELSAWQRQFTVTVESTALELVSIPGVFKHGGLDEGSALLLHNLAERAPQRVLDFGCGAGVLGLHLKARWPDAEVEMLDVSAEAVYAAQQSAQLNQLAVKVYPSDGLSEVQGLFDAVYSNPPFHTGVKTDYSITEALIRQVAAHLTPGGELRMVANAFLPYPRLIEQYIGPCRVVARTKSFNVYAANKQVKS